jgi:hypothetical protein
MKPSTPVALFEDEAQLARLVCQKLAKLLEGAVTIGFPILFTGQYEWREFLVWRYDVVRAYATVLHTVSGPTQDALRLRDASGVILDRLGLLQQALLGVGDQDDISRETAQSLGPPVASLFDAVEECGALIGLASDTFARSRSACELTIRSLGSPAPCNPLRPNDLRPAAGLPYCSRRGRPP